MMLIEIPWFSHRSVWHLIFPGVLERHPTLRFAVTEQGVAWLPRGLETLDWFYGRMTRRTCGGEVFGAAATKMTMTPTECFARNFSIGASFLRPSEAPLCRVLGIDHVSGGPITRTRRAVTRTRPKRSVSPSPTIAEPEVRAMVESTAASFYGFDLDRLQPWRPGRPPSGRRGPAPAARGLADHHDLQRVDPRQILRAWWVHGRAHDDGPLRRPRHGNERAVEAEGEQQGGYLKCRGAMATAVFETDPEIIAAVLPPPLEPGLDPLVRITITRVEMPGLPVFGAGWIRCPAAP